jgi:hypothetical protein
VCSVVVSIDSMFSRSMTDTVLSTHIILIDEWVICVSVCLCVCICGRVHFNGERREVDDWYKTFKFRFCVSVEVILWEVLKILFFQIQGLSVYHFIFVVYFMMVWYGAFRSLVYSNVFHISARG